jgi:transposase InsO family protein
MGPWPSPKVDRFEPIAAKYAEEWPAWGHRKIAALRADGYEVLGPAGELLGMAPAPISVVSDNGPCFRGEVLMTAFAGPDPLLRHVRTRVRSPQTNGVIERFFGTLKYEHLFRGVIADGDALDMEVHRFRIIYSTIRPHQALDDRVPSAAFNDCDQRKIAP